VVNSEQIWFLQKERVEAKEKPLSQAHDMPYMPREESPDMDAI